MATAVLRPGTAAVPSVERTLRVFVPIGRAFFAAVFILSSFGHFAPDTVQYAASQGAPLASLTVPLSGVMALLGGLSVALGYKARIGAALLIAFLLPVTLVMHQFWGIADPTIAAAQQAHFLKNVALIGASLLLLYFGAGPVSIDERHVSPRAEPLD